MPRILWTALLVLLAILLFAQPIRAVKRFHGFASENHHHNSRLSTSTTVGTTANSNSDNGAALAGPAAEAYESLDAVTEDDVPFPKINERSGHRLRYATSRQKQSSREGSRNLALLGWRQAKARTPSGRGGGSAVASAAGGGERMVLVPTEMAKGSVRFMPARPFVKSSIGYDRPSLDAQQS
ncbi:hypothetical protein BJ742DRAFT_800001 [Cladochytrium replicatum]|nr:hypothetical protein BJ742DRAFT_800001 [Cladochytrium replicatum]